MVAQPAAPSRPKATGGHKPRPAILLTACVVAAMLLSVPAATAQDLVPQLTFHDDADAPSSAAASCEFWVGGHNMLSPDGRLEAAHDLDTPDAHGHPLGNYSGTENDNGTYDFLVGPFTLHASDEYFVIAIAENETDPGTAGNLTYTACGDEGAEDPVPVGCPDDLTATANDDGSVSLSWTGNASAEDYTVHRKVAGDAAFDQIATTNQTSYRDMDTEDGVTYDYRVDARMDAGNNTTVSESCGTAQVTTIPNFGVIAGTIVGVALVGMYALARRRR